MLHAAVGKGGLPNVRGMTIAQEMGRLEDIPIFCTKECHGGAELPFMSMDSSNLEECYGEAELPSIPTDSSHLEECHGGVQLPTTATDSDRNRVQPLVESVSTPTCEVSSQLGCPSKVVEGMQRQKLVRNHSEDPSLVVCEDLAENNLRGYRFKDGIFMHCVLGSEDEECCRFVLPKCERQRVLKMAKICRWHLLHS